MKKKIIALCLIVSMLAIAIISGTIAYFTDVEDKDNTFVIGDIDIAIKERNGEPGIADYADNGENGDGDGYDKWLADQVLFPGVPVKKIVTVKNVGENAAFVRVTLTVPKYMDANFATDYINDWTQISKTTDDDNNTVYVFKYNAELEAGEETKVLLDNISVDNFIDEELNGIGEKNVKVYVEAIQTAGFANVDEALSALDTQVELNDKTAVIVDDADSLVEALENGQGAVFTTDINIDPANMSNAYGKTGINVKNGQTIDGNGNTIDIKGAGGTWDSGINTTGGTIKNITVTGSFRGIFINHNSDHYERVILENVTIDGTTYTISCDQGKNQGLTATNSTFNGWTSYAGTLGDAEFIGCSFGEGNGYAYMRPYAPTTFVNCDFEEGFEMDARAAVTFENCRLNGVLITADNLGTLVTSNIVNATVIG